MPTKGNPPRFDSKEKLRKKSRESFWDTVGHYKLFVDIVSIILAAGVSATALYTFFRTKPNTPPKQEPQASYKQSTSNQTGKANSSTTTSTKAAGQRKRQVYEQDPTSAETQSKVVVAPPNPSPSQPLVAVPVGAQPKPDLRSQGRQSPFWGFAYPSNGKLTRAQVDAPSDALGALVLMELRDHLGAERHTSDEFHPTQVLTVSVSLHQGPGNGECAVTEIATVIYRLEQIREADPAGTTPSAQTTTGIGSACVGNDAFESQKEAVKQAIIDLRSKTGV